MSFVSTSRVAIAKPDRPLVGRSLCGDLKQFTLGFAERGFKDTSVERIVGLAGTTASTFYYHSGGKAAPQRAEATLDKSANIFWRSLLSPARDSADGTPWI
ncbi:MAG: hypothetical protein JWO15_2205 [Sphingomonadales bacterium]|nr:hypothetical protein [Sphingomonadales bacterium]